MSSTAAAPARRILWGIAAVCFSNLLLEIVLTRIFSATMFYHFTFLAIALALFGMGAAGVYVYIRSDRFTAATVEQDLSWASSRFAAATILALIYVLANPIDLGLSIGEHRKFGLTEQNILQLILLNGVAALPFFFAGIVVSLAVTHFHKCIGVVYFYDLAGAAASALVCGVLLKVAGGPTLVLVIAALALGAAALFRPPRGLKGWVPLGVGVAIVLANFATDFIRVPTIKLVKSERVVFEKWNAFSRVTVERDKHGVHYIKIDSSAATVVASPGFARGRPWNKEIRAVAHHLHPEGAGKVLIIGAGGGIDIAHALGAGSRDVTGIEVNPIISESIMAELMTNESGQLYSRPGVRVVTDEGRSYIRRAKDRYDVIQATFVDTWAATAAGAFALTENTLYTVEAFEDYFSHLTDDGVVTMSRWVTGPQGPETARLLVLASAGLVAIGVEPTQTRKHMALVKHRHLATLIAKRTPFTRTELDNLDNGISKAGFQIVLSPNTPGDSELEKLVDAGPYSNYVAQFPHDVTPPTDDRPFFFYFVKPGELFRLGKHFGRKGAKLMNPAMWILLAFGIAIFALAVLFILLPLVVHRGYVLRRGSGRDLARRVAALVYFAVIGLAFITVEIALMQKLGLFLGHPSYGLIVVLFSVLIATAIGARMTDRVPDRRRVAFAIGAAAIIAVISLAYAGGLSGLLRDWVAWSLTMRVALSVAISATLGVVMGVMLPIGVRLVGDSDPELIPWGWGVNGATSVMGTVVATIMAIHVGFNGTLIAGGVMYLLAAATAFGLGRLLAPISGARASELLADHPGDEEE